MTYSLFARLVQAGCSGVQERRYRTTLRWDDLVAAGD